MPRVKTQQVFPNLKGGWSVKSKGVTRATKSFDTQQDAIAWARSKSKKQGLELVVHGRDGMVRSITSYPEPRRPQQNGRK